MQRKEQIKIEGRPDAKNLRERFEKGLSFAEDDDDDESPDKREVDRVFKDAGWWLDTYFIPYSNACVEMFMNVIMFLLSTFFLPSKGNITRGICMRSSCNSRYFIIFFFSETASKARNLFKQIDKTVAEGGEPVLRPSSSAQARRENRLSRDVSYFCLYFFIFQESGELNGKIKMAN